MRLPTGLLLRCHRDQSGQAIFIGLFYFLLLAGLSFMVFNSGDKANNKIAMQNAADASAVTGSGWYARGLNAIAMCNVAQTQFLSVIVLLDTMQTVAPLAQQNITDLVNNMSQSKLGQDGASSIPGTPNYQPYAQALDWLVVSNAAQEQPIVQRLNQMITQIPMDEYCTYDSGVLWQCCYVLNDLANQMVTITPEMCQREATKIATSNQADVGFLLPFSPQLPVTAPPGAPVGSSKSAFENFRGPMADAMTAETYTPGTLSSLSAGTEIPGYATHQGYVNRRRRSPPNPVDNNNPSPCALGPFKYMRQPLVEPEPMGLLQLSGFSTLYLSISESKLDMLFGGPDSNVPQFISGYDAFVAYVLQNGPGSVLETYVDTAHFFGRFGFPGADFYANINLRSPAYPSEPVTVYNGAVFAPGGYTRASMTDGSDGADSQENTFYLTLEQHWPPTDPWDRNPPGFFPALGIYLQHAPPYTVADMQTFYSTNVWRFCGALVQGQTPMRGKYLPPAGAQVQLAPVLLQGDAIPQTADNAFKWFNQVAFAYKNGVSQVWPVYFPNPGMPSDKLICYAQTEIYNNTCNNPHNWDTFTQDWRARLVRMNHWNWAESKITDTPTGAAAGYVTGGSTDPVLKMLRAYDAGANGSDSPDDSSSFVQLITH